MSDAADTANSGSSPAQDRFAAELRGFGLQGVSRCSSLLFGSLHYFEQGLAGAQQVTITGLTFGKVFSITGRIWMPMFAHAAFDLTAVALIYWNLESRVGHLIFR